MLLLLFHVPTAQRVSGDKVPSAKLAAAVLLVARRKQTDAGVAAGLEAETPFNLPTRRRSPIGYLRSTKMSSGEFQREHEARAQAARRRTMRTRTRTE